jgi:hypothetical protein
MAVHGRTWLVHLPLAEARHLAGTGHGWPATPQMRLAAALREWLAGVSRRRAGVVPVRKVIADLTLILETVPLPQRPVCGPFGPSSAGPRPPGRVDYLGSGIVRLDEDAITWLASLVPGDDFHVTHTDAGQSHRPPASLAQPAGESTGAARRPKRSGTLLPGS